MVAKLSDVPKTSRLQCPNCSRSIVAPPNCDMFKCICGQTMVVPGSEMAKRIQKQGTREGEPPRHMGAQECRQRSPVLYSYAKWIPQTAQVLEIGPGSAQGVQRCAHGFLWPGFLPC